MTGSFRGLIARFDEAPRPPGFAVPPESWDCHAHICGSRDRFPLSPQAIYDPGQCSIESYQHMLDTLGLAHGVIVHPSVYGLDNSCTFDAVLRSNGRWRGVAVFDENVSENEVRKFHEVGFRGTRINVATGGDSSALNAAKAIADRVRPFGWHLQIFAKSSDLHEFRPALESLEVDLVIDHMGNVDPELGTRDPGFQVLLAWLREGRCWAKVSGGYYLSKTGDLPYADVRPLVEALIEANQDRLVWGSNWPHPWHGRPKPIAMPNDGALLDVLASWVPDADVRRKILADNPGRLYR